MHWADVLANELLKDDRKHVLATGITPSGPIHIGNMREVLTTDAVYTTTLVSYFAAFIVLVVILLLHKQQRHQIRQQSRYNFVILITAAIILVIGHIFRFSAFHYSQISVAQPLMGTIVIFVLLFSFMVNRRIDVFNWMVGVGILLVLVGAFLIYG